MSEPGMDPAERLARELAREALFLPDRWRAWLIEALLEDLEAVDLEQQRINELNARMSEAISVLEAVAEHLGLEGPAARLALTMREFDAAPERVRGDWTARRVADAVRGSWQLAKAVAFTNERLPVAPERQWERGKGLARKRREGAFSLSAIAQWLETDPEQKTKPAYDRWRREENQRRGGDARPLLQAKSIAQTWALPWVEIVRAVEEQRLPGEERAAEDESEATTSDSAPRRTHAFILDPALRGERLRSAREARGWSIKEVSDAAGLDPSTVTKLEKGINKQALFENMVKLAEVLDLQLNDFVKLD